jgi:hypothetical protein
MFMVEVVVAINLSMNLLLSLVVGEGSLARGAAIA